LTHKSRPDYNNQEFGTTKAQKAHKGKKESALAVSFVRLGAPLWFFIFIRIYGQL
jgi:hypothetical protein